MWAEQTPATWKSAFRTHIARLRRALGSDANGPQLLHDSSGYRLVVPAGTVDIDVFQELIQQSKTSPTPEEQYELLQAASGLFLGEPFLGSKRHELVETADRLLRLNGEVVRQRRFLAIEFGKAQEVVDDFDRVSTTFSMWRLLSHSLPHTSTWETSRRLVSY